jgi:hypothetical protein
MHLPTSFPKKFWWLAALLLVLFLGLGCYGWKETLQQAAGHYSWPEVLDHASELVVGEAAIVVGHQYDQHWAVFAGKWGIKAVLAAAILQSAAMIFWRRLRRWRFRKVAGHHVYIGLGSQNRELALKTFGAGGKVAAVEPDEHNTAIGKLEDKGALVLCGSPSDPSLLRAAGVARAARLVIATGQDELNVEVADQAAVVIREHKKGTGKPVDILVCVDSPDMRELLRGRWALLEHSERLQARLVSFRSVALRHVLKELACELATKPDMRVRGPRILVVAERDFTEEFLRLAVPFVQVSGEAHPQFWVWTQRPGEEARFARCYPALDLVAQVHFIEEELETILLSKGLEGLGFDEAVVFLDNEAKTLAMADRLLRSPRFQVAKVRALTEAKPLIRLKGDERLDVMSLFEHGTKSPEFGDDALERAAQQNHEAYRAGLSEEAAKNRPNAREWEFLPEAIKETNRWAVLRRDVKKAVWESVSPSEKDSVLELLSRSEHQVWMAGKILDGWIAGKRDDARKIHDNICPYDDLTEEVKGYDRDQVRKALAG